MLKMARLSTIRFVNETVNSIKLSHPSTIPIQYIDWDAHADLKELPDADMIGLSGFGISENEKIYEVVFGLMLCTYNDPNLFRVTDFADTFFKAMMAEQRFRIYDPITGAAANWAVFENGTAVSPVARVEVRPTIQITASALIAPKP